MDHIPVRRAMSSSKDVDLMIYGLRPAGYRPRRARAARGTLLCGSTPLDGPRDMFTHQRVLRRRSIVSLFLQSRNRLRIGAVADCDRDIPPEAGQLRACHRASLHHAPKAGVRLSPEVDEARQVETLARLPWRIGRRGRRLVVRTDLLADVTPVHMATN